MKLSRCLMIGAAIGLCAAGAHAQMMSGFSGWVDDFRTRAAAQGIPPAVLDDALNNLQRNEKVLELDQKQPESKISFTQYLSNTVTDDRVRKGRDIMRRYEEPLKKISQRYGVPAKYVVALWGIESNYGKFPGHFSVVQSLATLAYEGRRADFFSNELIGALKILADEKMNAESLSGSWAGAMGGCQFMPSTYLRYAVDGNGDGKRDIWHSPLDVMASTANYLHSIGWNKALAWGKKVEFPSDFTEAEADIKHARSKAEWRKRGITLTNGKPLPGANTMLYAIYPGTPDEGGYLVSENFQVLLQWNYSRYFATAVGILADKIGGAS